MGRSWCVSLFLFLVLACGLVQAATYAYRNQAFSYDAPSAGATAVTWHASGASPACTSYPDGDDDWADVSFPGGFTFTFAGTNYAGVRIYSNGILAFGNDVSGFHRNWTPQALPITGMSLAYTGCPRGVPERLMLPYWIDIVAGTANSTAGASVRYELLGTAPNRRFVISWVNVKLFNTTTRYNFQVVLYEGTAGVNGNFEYRYTSGSSDGANATVGVQVSTTDFTQYSFDQRFIDTTNGTSIFWYPANQLATKGAEYRFDESIWSGMAGEVKDTSGNSQDAQRVGSASNIAGGKLCRGGGFTNNTSNAIIDAVATPVVPGNSGSVSFWYRSTNRWNTANTMLFDATRVANRPFFLMKRGNGRLRFAVADSSGTTVTAETGNLTYAANSWQHIGVTWNIRAGDNQTLIQIFINGSLVTSARGTTNGSLPAIGSIYIGDNRTSGVTPANGTPNGANGAIDEFYIYPIDVSAPQFDADMNLTRPTCTMLDHFRIIHDGTSSCGTARITIEAHDMDHALFSLAGSTITLSTSTGHGAWSVVNAINPVINTAPGSATYTFSNESRVVFALSNPHVETLNINVASGSITERSGTGFICTAADYTYGSVCDADLVFAPCLSQFNACHDHAASQCGTAGRLHTRLVGSSFTTDVVALDAGGNPASNFSGKAVVSLIARAVPGGVDAQNCFVPDYTQILDNAATSFTGGRLTVNANVSGAWREARIKVVCDSTNCPPSGVTACSADNFAIRPQAFAVSSTNANADATGTAATATPAIKAGDPFSLTATAVAGYGATPQIDNLRVAGHAGATGPGNLSGTFGVANPVTGEATGAAFRYSEVGYFRLDTAGIYDDSFTSVDQPSDCTNDFSSTAVNGKFGCKFGTTAATDYFGRFIPHRFDTEIPTHGCGGFTYSGQPFPLRVRALNAGGGTTVNYSGAFAKTVTLADANGAPGTFNPAALAAGDFAAGVANSTGMQNVSFTFVNKQTAPATLRVRASDGEATSAAGNEGTTPIRSGRLVLSNAHGSEWLALTLPIQTQYWSGSAWATNIPDSCTDITGALVFVSNPAGMPSPSGGAISAGKGSLSFPAPNQKGSVEVCANLGSDGDNPIVACRTGTSHPWLQGSWDANGNYDDNPSARATFGIYPGRAPVIYRRERY